MGPIDPFPGAPDWVIVVVVMSGIASWFFGLLFILWWLWHHIAVV